MSEYKMKFKEKQKLLLNYHNNLITSSENYIHLLKVIGNNYKYNLNNQISIATFNLTGKKSPSSIGGAMNCPIVF